jgi:hypothetical protein
VRDSRRAHTAGGPHGSALIVTSPVSTHRPPKLGPPSAAELLAATSRLLEMDVSRPTGRRPVLLCLLLAALATIVGLGAARAEAIVVRPGAGGHGYGVTLRSGVDPTALAGVTRSSSASTEKSGAASRTAEVQGGNLKYEGGPVMHSTRAHVIYWDPNGEFTSTSKELVKSFFSSVEHDSGLATNVFAIAGQYTDSSGNAAYSSTYAGASEDKSAYPASGCTVPTKEADSGPPYTKCITDSQLQNQLTRYISENSLPRGSSQLYFVLVPHTVVICYYGSECSNTIFCAYHSYIEGGSTKEVIYAAIPFSLLDAEWAKGCQYDGNSGIQTPNGDRSGNSSSTRFVDVALSYASHEYVEAATDPLVGEKTAWVDREGYEIGDKCHATGEGEDGLSPNAFLPTRGGSAGDGNLYDQVIDGGRFYLQSEWDNASESCLTEPAALKSAAFSYSPQPPQLGAQVSFGGSVSDPYGKPSYSWSFGDGGTGSGSSPAHSYSAAGEYTVTMTVVDALTGSSAAVQHTIDVTSFTASTDDASTIGTSSATFNGRVNPNGKALSECYFEYGASSSYGSTVQCSSLPGSGEEAVSVSAAIGGLSSGATYHFRLVAINAEGVRNGADRTFTTSSSSSGSSPGGSSSSSSSSASAGAGTPPGAPAADSAPAGLSAKVNPRNGTITIEATVSNPGTLSWLLTFPNGRFGVFVSARCKTSERRLNGRCRARSIVFAKGSRSVTSAGLVSFTVKPSRSALIALKNAVRRRTSMTVRLELQFQSALGGAPFSTGLTIAVRLLRR